MISLLLLQACQNAPSETHTVTDGNNTQTDTTALNLDLPSISAQGIILIQVDALRMDHLGVYGYARDTTPTLSSEDWVVVDGLNATSSWTVPSVSSLMSSLAPYVHGVQYDDNVDHHLNAMLTAPRWSDALGAAGVHTLLASGSNFVVPDNGIGGGFDQSILFGKTWPDNHLMSLESQVIDWLKMVGDEPFFIVMHVMNAHDPYYAPPDAADTWIADEDIPFNPANSMTQSSEINAAFMTDPEGTAQAVIDVYDEQILGIDQAIAHLEGTLSANGMLDKTLLVLTADHGESLGDGGQPFFGHGNELTQEQLRIPLLLKHPSLPAGPRDCLSENIDTIPTLVQLMGWSAHLEAQGQALQSGCRTISRSELYGPDDTLYQISVSDAHYRLTRGCANGEEKANDLVADPMGITFVSPDTIPQIDALRLSLDAYSAEMDAIGSPACKLQPPI